MFPIINNGQTDKFCEIKLAQTAFCIAISSQRMIEDLHTVKNSKNHNAGVSSPHPKTMTSIPRHQTSFPRQPFPLVADTLDQDLFFLILVSHINIQSCSLRGFCQDLSEQRRNILNNQNPCRVFLNTMVQFIYKQVQS